MKLSTTELNRNLKIKLLAEFHEKLDYIFSEDKIDFTMKRKNITVKGAKIRLRNACIEQTFFAVDADFDTYLHSDIKKDVCQCEERATHYGVNIGDVIQTSIINIKDHASRKATIYRYLRAYAITIHVV